LNHMMQISGHGSFREGNAQLLQFRVNLGLTPVGIVLDQMSDQIPDLSLDPWPSAARTGSPASVESKTGPKHSKTTFPRVGFELLQNRCVTLHKGPFVRRGLGWKLKLFPSGPLHGQVRSEPSREGSIVRASRGVSVWQFSEGLST